MKFLKKTAVLFLALTMLLPAFCSCALLSAPSDEEIRGAMEELLPLAYEATYIVYGPGIEVEENFAIDPDWTVSHYAKVHPKYKYQTILSVKELILKAHTEGYAAELYEYAFEGSEDLLSRYNETDGKISMDVTKEALDMADEIYYETARVLKGTAYACEVEEEYTMDEGKTREVMVIQMAKENGRWLFDGPTY